jgi:hypothetical protein
VSGRISDYRILPHENTPWDNDGFTLHIPILQPNYRTQPLPMKPRRIVSLWWIAVAVATVIGTTERLVLATSTATRIPPHDQHYVPQHHKHYRTASSRALGSIAAFSQLQIITESDYNEEMNQLWYELPLEALEETQGISIVAPSPRRKMIWWGRYDDEESWKIVPDGNDKANQEHEKLHPLRSPRYQVNVMWTKKYNTRNNNKSNSVTTKALPSTLNIEFDISTGYCRAISAGDDAADAIFVGVGEWQVFPWGLYCQLWIDDSVQMILNAGVHLNPFGTHAKLVQGTILVNHYGPNQQYQQQSRDGGGIADKIQDEPMIRVPKQWFRPVAGTFEGVSL